MAIFIVFIKIISGLSLTLLTYHEDFIWLYQHCLLFKPPVKCFENLHLKLRRQREETNLGWFLHTR